MVSSIKMNDAVRYLFHHGYENVRGETRGSEERVSFRGDTGETSWEQFIASKNGWNRMEKDFCCYNVEEDRGLRFCPRCGNGINGMVTYIHDGVKSDPSIIENCDTVEKRNFPKNL